MTTRECDNVAAEGRGLHYQSRAWAALAEDADWTGMWPVIDRSGHLTGQAVDSDETAVGWLNVDDEAMIPEDEARAGHWEIDADEGRACEPQPIGIEVANANETIRICGGLEDYGGLEHPRMDYACEAYHRAACDALATDPRASRLFSCQPIGQRVLHSAWMGAKFTYSCGALGTMKVLDQDEKAAVSAADDAGREAARKVLE